jgi:V/A-type H+-transporting ATPase subunit I
MALAIAGGVISFSINLILGMLYSSIVPKEMTLLSAIYVIPLLVGLAFVFLAAHFFNLFLNSIGAFIHTMRLHFAEFFGKFYESGGEKFTTFKVKRRFTKVKGGD